MTEDIIKAKLERDWEMIYLTALFLFIISRVLGNAFFSEFTAVSYVDKALLLLSCGTAAVKLGFDFLGKRVPIIVSVLIIVPVLGCVYFLSKGKTSVFMFLLLFSAAGFNVDYDKILKCFALSLCGTVSVVIVSSLMGVIESRVMSGWRNGVLIDRASCGFHYFYEASHYVFFATLVFLYYRKERAHFWEYPVLILINVFVFQKAATKTPFFLSVCAILGCLLLKLVPYLRKYKKGYSILAMAIYPVCAVFILVFSVQLDLTSPFGKFCDMLTSSRLSFNSMAYETFGLSLFGNVAEWTLSGQNYNFVDSSYLATLFEYGIVTLAGILSACTAMGYYSRKRMDTYFVLLFSIIAVYSMFDSWLIRPECNVFLFTYPYIYTASKKEWIC